MCTLHASIKRMCLSPAPYTGTGRAAYAACSPSGRCFVLRTVTEPGVICRCQHAAASWARRQGRAHGGVRARTSLNATQRWKGDGASKDTRWPAVKLALTEVAAAKGRPVAQECSAPCNEQWICIPNALEASEGSGKVTTSRKAPSRPPTMPTWRRSVLGARPVSAPPACA